MSTILCSVCELPLIDHSDDMVANCSALDLSKDAPVVRHGASQGGDENPGMSADATARWVWGTHDLNWFDCDEVNGPRARSYLSVASVLMGWANDMKRELEELGTDGPVGSLIPYHPDAGTPPEDIVGLIVALTGVSGTEDKGLIGQLRDVVNDASAALASMMDKKCETYAGMDVERHWGTSRKNWQREVLAKEVATRAISKLGEELADFVSDPEMTTGAASMGGAAVANTFLKAFRLEPRAGALRELKIDPDLYCESEPGRPGVIVRQHRDTIE